MGQEKLLAESDEGSKLRVCPCFQSLCLRTLFLDSGSVLEALPEGRHRIMAHFFQAAQGRERARKSRNKLSGC